MSKSEVAEVHCSVGVDSNCEQNSQFCHSCSKRSNSVGVHDDEKSTVNEVCCNDSAWMNLSSKDFCLSAIPATMVISSDNCELSGTGVEVGLAADISLAEPGKANPSTARYRWTKASISSKVGVGLCSNSFNLRRLGRPFIDCR